MITISRASLHPVPQSDPQCSNASTTTRDERARNISTPQLTPSLSPIVYTVCRQEHNHTSLCSDCATRRCGMCENQLPYGAACLGSTLHQAAPRNPLGMGPRRSTACATPRAGWFPQRHPHAQACTGYASGRCGAHRTVQPNHRAM